MKNIDELLNKLNACREDKDWAKGKTFVEIYTTCDRGDWLCWLFARTNPEDVQLLTLVKGHQANTVRHLMKDKRSLKAVDTAIAFGEGRATKDQLSMAARAAYHAARAADYADYAEAACAAAHAATHAAARAADAAHAAAVTASYAAPAAASFAVEAAPEDAEQASRQLTANIFRKYISMDKFKIKI